MNRIDIQNRLPAREVVEGRNPDIHWSSTLKARAQMVRSFLLVIVLLGSSVSFAQLPSSRCDSPASQLEDCSYLTENDTPGNFAFDEAPSASSLDPVTSESSQNTPSSPTDKDSTPSVSTAPPVAPEEGGFHWRPALKEAFTFLVIEHAYVVHSDFGWVVSENGWPFNHYWRDYTQSLSRWIHSGWNDGDPNWYGYVGHPIQGALTEYIQIQNDPPSRKLVFSKTKAYWWSRFKAFWFNAAYSTQWNLGPVSEVTVEKYGTKDRPPWNYNGSFPCSHHCLTGVGQIDVVMTPLGGTGWLIGEDFLDKDVIQRVEDRTQNRFLIDTVRVGLNPIRAGANMLHGEHPWYRASRDAEGMSLLKSDQKTVVPTPEAPKQFPNSGDVFVGYSHIGSTHCEAPISDEVAICDPYSAKIANLSGWNTSVEKKYLRYFGLVADFGGQYGSFTESNYLFGLRGGASIWGVRPFAEVMIGAIRDQESGVAGSKPNTSFAEALGVGADLRLTHRLGWRIQADELRTELTAIQQRNLRVSTGLLVHF